MAGREAPVPGRILITAWHHGPSPRSGVGRASANDGIKASRTVVVTSAHSCILAGQVVVAASYCPEIAAHGVGERRDNTAQETILDEAVTAARDGRANHSAGQSV